LRKKGGSEQKSRKNDSWKAPRWGGPGESKSPQNACEKIRRVLPIAKGVGPNDWGSGETLCEIDEDPEDRCLRGSKRKSRGKDRSQAERDKKTKAGEQQAVDILKPNFKFKNRRRGGKAGGQQRGIGAGGGQSGNTFLKPFPSLENVILISAYESAGGGKHLSSRTNSRMRKTEANLG